jgi:formylglycine-generating enzyme required for sulfatase activity
MTATDTAWHPLADGNPPVWATGWGQDSHGVFVEFAVDTVSQRLRWIPPGRFQMGSPESEPGRFDSEGPQHAVTISRGFWLFDTPCTQALWQVVMGDNPSRFKSPDRPVERVSWNDIQDFLTRINRRLPGVDLGLPSEAQWEYACRAGTATALYTGDIEILGENNAPALDPIAWYGGNSGVDFDLKGDGHDSKDWPGKQYPHEKAGTHPVRHKRPNPWGLHDMLGNVWEWCEDGQRTYEAKAATDPLGSLEAGGLRVVRGGSWSDYARDARAACRDQSPPDGRDDYLGFRCARVQE